MFTTEELRRIRADLDVSLARVAAAHGLASLKLGRITYDHSGSFRGTIEGTKAGALSRDAARYQVDATYAGDRWPKLGETIQWGGKSFTVTGMGAGGAIYGTDAGKGYKIKRADWVRKYGTPFQAVDSEKSPA